MFGIGKKNTVKKAPWTMVMQVANAHSFSIGFVGIQLTHGYVAALALSSASVIVGMILSLQSRFAGTGNTALVLAILFGVPLGGIVAFVFDSMTLFGLKMVHESKGWKMAFAFVLIGLGIGLSTMAGDQMWQVVYQDWHGIVLAMSVSCVIIMMDVWHVEHEKAVKKASQQPDAMQTALNTEVEVVVDKKLRQYTHEQLNSPEMEQHLRTQSMQSVQEIVQAKFNKRLEMFAGAGERTIQEIATPQQPAMFIEGEVSHSDEKVSHSQEDEQAEVSHSDEKVSHSQEDEQAEVSHSDEKVSHSQEDEIKTNIVRSYYADHRDVLIEAVTKNPDVSLNELVRLTGGRPRVTVSRWRVKAEQEIALQQAEVSHFQEDGQAEVSHLDEKVSHSQEDEQAEVSHPDEKVSHSQEDEQDEVSHTDDQKNDVAA
jgi:hypothetical protein